MSDCYKLALLSGSVDEEDDKNAAVMGVKVFVREWKAEVASSCAHECVEILRKAAETERITARLSPQWDPMRTKTSIFDYKLLSNEELQSSEISIPAVYEPIDFDTYAEDEPDYPNRLRASIYDSSLTGCLFVITPSATISAAFVVLRVPINGDTVQPVFSLWSVYPASQFAVCTFSLETYSDLKEFAVSREQATAFDLKDLPMEMSIIEQCASEAPIAESVTASKLFESGESFNIICDALLPEKVKEVMLSQASVDALQPEFILPPPSASAAPPAFKLAEFPRSLIAGSYSLPKEETPMERQLVEEMNEVCEKQIAEFNRLLSSKVTGKEFDPIENVLSAVSETVRTLNERYNAAQLALWQEMSSLESLQLHQREQLSAIFNEMTSVSEEQRAIEEALQDLVEKVIPAASSLKEQVDAMEGRQNEISQAIKEAAAKKLSSVAPLKFHSVTKREDGNFYATINNRKRYQVWGFICISEDGAQIGTTPQACGFLSYQETNISTITQLQPGHFYEVSAVHYLDKALISNKVTFAYE